MDVTAGEVGRRDRLGLAGLGVVRAGQVGGAAERFGDDAVDDFEGIFRRLAGCNRRLGFSELLLVGVDRAGERAGQFASEAAVEFGALLGVGASEAGFPVLAGLGRSQAGKAPGVEHVSGDREGFLVPAKCLAGRGDLVGAERRAVNLVGAGLVRSAEADHGLGGDHGRLVGLLGGFDGSGDRFRIVAIDGDRVPVGCAEAGVLVGRVGQRDRAVDRDAVVVPEDDQLVELQVAGERDRFLADAFHEAAVACEHVRVVVLQVRTKLGFELLFGECHADGGSDALAERAGGGLDAGWRGRIPGGRPSWSRAGGSA